MKYRKKPVVIDAIQINDNIVELNDFMCGCGMAIRDTHTTIVTIETLEGTMSATNGAYIIKGVHGEYYPCAKDIFEATYECLNDEGE